MISASFQLYLPLLVDAEQEGAARYALEAKSENSSKLPLIERDMSQTAGTSPGESAESSQPWLDTSPSRCLLEMLRDNAQGLASVEEDHLHRQSHGNHIAIT